MPIKPLLAGNPVGAGSPRSPGDPVGAGLAPAQAATIF
jgi:hypothetical protein